MQTVALFMGLLLLAPLAAEEKQQAPAKTEPRQAQTEASQQNRPTLSGAAARRNENVQVNRIDNDALKEANIRLGDNVTIVSHPPVEVSYYATEHGRPAGDSVVMRSAPLAGDWHGEVFELLQNSVFNARTFFQVGSVLPSRQNSYGLRFGGPVPRLGSLTGSFSQRKVRGMVNGNVLVPLAGERTSTSGDPAVRRVVERFLSAYPNQLPNRPDFDPRALNTNAPQRVDDTTASLRLDREFGSSRRLSLSHLLNRQRIDAFQLVAGQNPDTELHSHRSQMTYRQNLGPATEMAVAAGFARQKSVLTAEPNAVGPRVRFGYQIEELGPDSMFPIDRAVNTFRWGALFTHKAAGGAHQFTFGADSLRTQLNGIETANQRGLIWFSNNFGRTAIENLRLGTPTTYEVTIGEMARGFRNMGANFYFGDQWRVNSRLQVFYGLRYNLESTPYEVNGRNEVPYASDRNNFSPRFSVAWRLGGDRVVRTGYTVSFGGIPPVTYGQVRYNLPNARYIVVQNPDLLNPLQGIDLKDPNGRSSPTVLARNLVSPYAHQYNFSVEDRVGKTYLVRVGYIGSRTFKMLDSYQLNRAVPVPGIPLTTATVNARRPDQRYYDVKNIVNAGAAYMDAAQLTVESSYRRGLAWSASYTFGKALDTGADYSSTGANNDINKGRSQSGDLVQQDRKGLSNFDSTHALLFSYSYDLPRAGAGRLGWAVNGWQISGTTLIKSGTPLTLYLGSDAPGFGNVDGGSGDRPNIVDASILGLTIGDPNTAPLILRRDRFAYVVPGDARGNLGRGTFRKSPIANFNAAVSKQWRWDGGREWSLLLRGEAFNLTNHPQFDEPQRNLSSPAFGKITNTLNDGRVLQMSVRIIL